MRDAHGIAAERPGPADMIEIYYAPSAVFERRRNGGFGLPLAVLIIASAVLILGTAGLMQPIVDAETSRGMAQMMKANPKLTPEQVEKVKGIGGNLRVLGALAIGVFALLSGLALWVVGKIVGVKQELVAATTAGVFAFFPRLLEMVVNGAQAAVLPESSLTGRYSVSLGLGRMLDPATSPMMLALLGRVDLFTLWVTALLAIGLRVTGRATGSQAALAGVMMWIIGALPGVLTALRMS
ncbi:MAG: YIP1 family protein [Gemmatimonadales bacterium]|nr:YIP1 family protein [Gemmatimonadales bacterium]